MPIELIALDLDGTLLDSNGRLSSPNKEAIRQAIAQGIMVILATGKTRWSALHIIDELDLQAPGVFSQGLVICNADGSIRYETTLAPQAVRPLLAYIESENLPYLAYWSGGVLAPYDHPYRELLHTKYDEPLGRIIGLFSGQLDDYPLNKLLISDEAHNDATRAELTRRFGDRLTITQAVPEYIEVLPRGASKGAGVRWLLEDLDIDPTAVLAAGDGENDVELVQMAGIGIAMGNAHEKVKAVATAVVGTNDESGVAEAIRRYVLANPL